MKKIFLFVLMGVLAGAGQLLAQDQPISPSVVRTGVYHGLSPALRDLPVLTDAEFQQMVIKGEKKALNKELKKRHYPFADQALPKGPDPVWQAQMGKTPSAKAPIANFSGQTSPYYPPDANGTAGPTYYMQTINTVYTIYNKSSGAIVAGPTAMNLLFSGVTGSNYNDGDPLVLYDEQADRWVAVEFSISGSNDYMLVAVSATNDPTGSWHKYSFDVDDMPDYEKFGVWRDGYYMGTNNSSGNDIYVFQRDQMLNGGTAQMVGFNNAWRPTTIDGFMCVPPVDNDGAFAPAGSPGLFITMNDDAIGGGSDQLWIYELAVNWTSPSSSSFTRVQQLNVPAFDSNFGNNWDNIKQPGTTRELDAIPMVIMNRPQYRNFGSYQTLVCCHTVDVDGTDHAGVRWYELRRTTGTWTLRQSGTYAPDGNSRWMGSIAMNGNGQLGLGYSISSTSVYPGIRYCGQSSSANAAASGVLDIAEEVIQNGSSSQTSYNRWGDYSNICVDPTNDNTFWFTSEYGGSRQTKIASFEFTPPALAANFAGTPTTVCPGGTVNFTDLSTGSPTSWSWTFTGGTPSTSTAQNPVITYNTPGVYNVSLTVSNGSSNDTKTLTNYITVSTITANFMGSPTNVTIGNAVTFSDLTSCNPTSWTWSFPGGTPSTSTAQNPVITYNTAGTYNVTLTAGNASGSDVETKTAYITVSEVQISYCNSQGNNYSYEWIGRVAFGSFLNVSGASGYTDFTSQTVNMTAGSNISLTLTPQFSGSTYTEYWRVWIDYNKDGDFLDAGEQVFAPAGSNSALSGNFTVQSGVSGTTRMRVTMKYASAPTSCETFSYGEVEDYTVSFGQPLPPVANFSASPTTVAEGNSVQFTDLSTNSPTSWSWSFSGGTPSTSSSQNPGVTYNTAGTYNVSLTASNATGSDIETKTGYITVVAVPSCANVVAPSNGATGVLITSNLVWSSVPDASGYILYFGTNNPPTNIVNGTNLGNVTSYNPAGDLNYSTVYYWKVVPYNANGQAVGCAVSSFTTEVSTSTSVELSYTDFESGWGIWTDGGGDCSLYYRGTYAYSGTYSADIQDNSGVASSFYMTNGVDVATPGFVQIDVEFIFIAVSMETGEDFWVQYYNGSTWQTVAAYASGSSFSNNIFYSAKVSIMESNYTFPTNMKIRFMCDASNNTDDVYIDNIRITASTQPMLGPNYLISLSDEKVISQYGTDVQDVRIYPNPVKNVLNISMDQDEDAEMYIYNIKGQQILHRILQANPAEIDMSPFENGVYMVYIITVEEVYTKKFIKQ